MNTDDDVPAFWRRLGLPGLADVHTADRVAHLGRLGVRMFTALAYAHRPGMAADLNDWTLDFAARTPGCLPSATFFPEPGVVGYLRDALDRGARVSRPGTPGRSRSAGCSPGIRGWSR